MAKKTPSKKITKQEFDLDMFRKEHGMDNEIKNKDLSWIPLSTAYAKATNIPGIPRGYFSSFRGHSNTGKSTAMYEAVAGAQRIGDFSIMFDTEDNWDWAHARRVGVEYDEVINTETGELEFKPKNMMLFRGSDLLRMYGNVDYSNGDVKKNQLRGEPVLEDVARCMNYLLDQQDAGKLPFNLLFLWDSVGSLNGWKAVISKAQNNQWNAGSLTTAFRPLIYHRIPSSKRLDSPYTNTFAVVNQIWIDNVNTVVKHRGGEAFFLGPRIITHFGGILTHSTKALWATSGGEKFQFGIETKVRIEKNQVNGVEGRDKKILSTVHGYWDADDLEGYKKKHKDDILSLMESTLDDFTIEIEEFDDDESNE